MEKRQYGETGLSVSALGLGAGQLGDARLSEADVIAYPYQTTGESASAAVRFGLASGKPVVVTPLPIFDDVNGVVHVFPACDPVALASWFRSHHDHARESSTRVDEIQTQAARWREEHCYSKVATKLHGMLTTLFYLHKHPPH